MPIAENEVNVQIILKSQNYIHALATPPAPAQPWLCTSLYSPPHPDPRKIFWEGFPINFPNTSTPWLLLGDFNKVMDQSEKKGGRPVTYAQTQPFLNLMDQMGYIDLGFKGDPFTWTNNQQGQDHIQERLDRAIANQH